jgi:hypothetical protein
MDKILEVLTMSDEGEQQGCSAHVGIFGLHH